MFKQFTLQIISMLKNIIRASVAFYTGFIIVSYQDI